MQDPRIKQPSAVVVLGAAPLGAPRTWARLPARPESLPLLREHPVVILARDAIESLDIRATLRAAPTGSIVLCVTGVPTARLTEWIRLGAELVTEADGLAQLVRERLAHLRQRVPLVLAEWSTARVEPGSAGWSALSVIPALERPFRVRQWHEALGFSRDKLLDLSQAELSAKPSDVLWGYVAIQVRRLRQQGHPLGRVAATLGYSDAAALVHAWQRREAPPPPGQERPPTGRALLSDERRRYWFFESVAIVQNVPPVSTPLTL